MSKNFLKFPTKIISIFNNDQLKGTVHTLQQEQNHQKFMGPGILTPSGLESRILQPKTWILIRWHFFPAPINTFNPPDLTLL